MGHFDCHSEPSQFPRRGIFRRATIGTTFHYRSLASLGMTSIENIKETHHAIVEAIELRACDVIRRQTSIPSWWTGLIVDVSSKQWTMKVSWKDRRPQAILTAETQRRGGEDTLRGCERIDVRLRASDLRVRRARVLSEARGPMSEAQAINSHALRAIPHPPRQQSARNRSGQRHELFQPSKAFSVSQRLGGEKEPSRLGEGNKPTRALVGREPHDVAARQADRAGRDEEK